MAPPATRIYAVGDVHGSIEPLKKLHKLILDEELKRGSVPRSVIIYLGDYIDRGEDSKEVINHIMRGPLKGFEYIYIRGNHEQMLLEFLENPEKAKSWFTWGADSTLRSYGIDYHMEISKGATIADISKKFAKKIPESHVEFCKKMKIYHIEGDYIFVHAGLLPGVSLEKQDEEVMMMIRNEFFESDYDFGKNVVFGHTIFSKPFVKNGRIGIDTGAFATGMLTCVVLEKDKVDFLHT